MRPVKRFTIDRAVWLRGEKPGDTAGCFGGSFLLRESDRKRCCIGIYLSACGVPDDDLLNIGTAGGLVREKPHVAGLVPGWLLKEERESWSINSTAAEVLMDVNDDDTSDEERREANVASMFKEHGVVVDFVGDPR